MAAKKYPNFDFGICTACGVCMGVCPLSCIELSKVDVDFLRKAYPVLEARDRCTGCGICNTACPVEAIKMEEIILQPAVA